MVLVAQDAQAFVPDPVAATLAMSDKSIQVSDLSALSRSQFGPLLGSVVDGKKEFSISREAGSMLTSCQILAIIKYIPHAPHATMNTDVGLGHFWPFVCGVSRKDVLA